MMAPQPAREREAKPEKKKGKDMAAQSKPNPPAEDGRARIVNEPLDFELPKMGAGAPWRRWIDTALDSPNDIVPWQTTQAIFGAI